MKKIYLGICVSHGASASLIIDGEIILPIKKKGLIRLKFYRIPKTICKKCIEYVSKNNLTITEAGFTTINLPVFPYKYPLDNYFLIEDWIDYYSSNFYSTEKNFISN